MLGLMAGIALDAVWPVPLAMAVSVFLGAGVVVFAGRRGDERRHLAILAAAVAVGALLHDVSFRHWPADHVVRRCGQEPVLVRLTGTVVSVPAVRPVQTGSFQAYPQLPRTRMLVAAERLEGRDTDVGVSGIVSVLVRGPALDVAVGDRIELLGSIHLVAPQRNPGTRDWALYHRRNGILVEMACRGEQDVKVVPGGPRTGSWLERVRCRTKAAMLDDTFPSDVPGSQLLSALVLGQRSAVDEDLNEAFIRSGTVHYLSVSGAHVGMLAGTIWLLAPLLGASKRGAAVWAIMAVTAYGVLAEPRPPILRAVVMTNLLGLAILLRRPVRTANWLPMAAFILLVLKPTQLFQADFQLSFVTVVAVIYLSPRLYSTGSTTFRWVTRRDDPLLSPEMQLRLNPTAWRRFAYTATRGFGLGLSVSLAAWMVGTLVGVYHFQRVAMWGWLNSLLLAPLVALVLVVGLFKSLIAMALPPASSLLAPLLSVLTDGLVGVVELMAEMPGAGLITPAMGGELVVLGLAFFALWMIQPWLRLGGRWLGAAALAVLTAIAWGMSPAGPTDTLRMHVLSVGNGTACVIQLPNARTLCYDIGSMPPYDVEKWAVGPLLASQRTYRVAGVILSHANLDHYCGLPELIERRSVEAVMATPHFEHVAHTSSAVGRLMAGVKANGVPWLTLARGDHLTGTGEVLVEVLWPPREEVDVRESNDTSMVLRISYAGRRILVCGDIEERALQQLLGSADLKADVLLLPHHGSVEPSTAAFIGAVDPEYCIRSSGRRDHETRNSLLELVEGRCYFNTAEDGAIEVVVDPARLVVTPQIVRDR